MVFGFGLSLTAINTLSAVQRAINILKSAGPGAWYDPSDLTTLFQDSAGTTPVTAVEQPVGLMLDKSQGLVLGAELVSNGDNETALFAIQGGIVSSDTVARASAPGGGFAASSTSTTSSSVAHRLYGISPMLAGKTYQFTGRFYVPTGGIGTFKIYDNADGSWFGISSTTKDQWVPFSFIRTAKATNWDLGIGDNVANVVTSGQVAYWIDDLSVRELPGNHLIQPTATSRPTLSSRYNLLTKTEAFDDVYWAKGSTSVTANSATAPDGTNTADSLVEAAATAATYIGRIAAGLPVTADTFVFSLYVKANGRNQVGLSLYGGGGNKYITAVYDLSAGTVSKTQAGSSGTITSTSITASGGGWYRIVMSGNTAAPAQIQAYVYPTNSTTPTIDQYGTPLAYTGDGTSGIYIWGASLVPAADASLPYQRVNTATDYDYDFSKFPAYLKFDGVDDSMYSAASVDFTSTDKMTVFAGVHKASDAAAGVVSELSGDANSNNGSFFLLAPRSGSDNAFAFASKGTTLVLAPGNSTPAPTTKVVSVVGDISSPKVEIRLNGVSQYSTAGSQGTGNYGNHVLYIGRRANASLPFSGRIYQLAIKGKALSAGEIATVESFVNSKTKAY